MNYDERMEQNAGIAAACIDRSGGAAVGSVLGRVHEMRVTPVMKDSGERQQFEGGAQRDSAAGKPQFSLLSPHVWEKLPFGRDIALFLLHRDVLYLESAFDGMLGMWGYTGLLEWLRQGSLKYSRFNWALGMNLSRVFDSLGRHLCAVERGDIDEDHGSACMCNMMFLIHYIKEMDAGRLDPKWNDLFDFNLYNKEANNGGQQ